MKQKVKIIRDGETLYKGRIINIRVKEDAIIAKSVELFDDDEPCIIHQSYVVKEYANYLSELLSSSPDKKIVCKDYLDELSFLDYKELQNIVITLG